MRRPDHAGGRSRARGARVRGLRAASAPPGGPITPYDPCIFLPQLPDLVPYSFKKEALPFSENTKTKLTIVIKNRGCVASGYAVYAIKLTLDNQAYYGATYAPTSNAGIPAGGIPRGATQTFTTVLDFAPYLVDSWGGDWHVEVDAIVNQVHESNENNNVAFYAN
jgi:hypothetical protein